MKSRLRKELKEKLHALTERTSRSERIWERLASLPEFQRVRNKAGAVMLYLNLPEEVETTRFLPLLSPSSVIVPYCVGNDLRLFRLESLEELQPQTMGILEPKAELVEIADRKFEPKNLDLVLVPGLGFDLEGQRIGRGGGFYDRFLAELPQNVLKIALAFETQLLPSGRIPVEKHDQRVDTIVTENRAILCR